jgi:hypothetical protein
VTENFLDWNHQPVTHGDFEETSVDEQESALCHRYVQEFLTPFCLLQEFIGEDWSSNSPLISNRFTYFSMPNVLSDTQAYFHHPECRVLVHNMLQPHSACEFAPPPLFWEETLLSTSDLLTISEFFLTIVCTMIFNFCPQEKYCHCSEVD